MEELEVTKKGILTELRRAKQEGTECLPQNDIARLVWRVDVYTLYNDKSIRKQVEDVIDAMYNDALILPCPHATLGSHPNHIGWQLGPESSTGN